MTPDLYDYLATYEATDPRLRRIAAGLADGKVPTAADLHHADTFHRKTRHDRAAARDVSRWLGPIVAERHGRRGFPSP
jgi:hypothetical protein